MTEQNKPKGILRNRGESTNVSFDNGASATSDSAVIEGEPATFDRHAVLLNTKANAQIHEVGNAIIKKHQTEIAEELTKQGKSVSDVVNGAEDGRLPEHLKWDEVNLYLTEQEKNSTMKITEPKTPYQGTVGESEYYKEDDENLEEAGFVLGEPELPVQSDATIQNDRIIKDESAQDDEDEELEETPEEKHRRFEELRKKHYFMKGAVLHHTPANDDDDDDKKN